MKKTYSLLLPLALLSASSLSAQVSFDGAGAYEEDFNSLTSANNGNTPYAWTDDSTLAGWYAEVDEVSTSDLLATSGTVGSTNLNSFGVDGNTDRSLGVVSSLLGSQPEIASMGLLIENNGAVDLEFSLSYLGEQWRVGNTTASTLAFSYQIGATDLHSGTWTDVSGLDFTGPNTVGGNDPLNGYSSGNQQAINGVDISGLTLAPGESAMLRWQISGKNGDGLGIDNLVLNAVAPIPEPSEASLIVVGGAILALSFRSLRRRKAS